ncbi:MAG: DUF1330 domain-containing protein, partial [Pseudomonadota bacterium]
EIADYTATPELAPEGPISGREAYDLYSAHTLPFLEASGGEVLFSGDSKNFLIGPLDEQWDHVLLVKHQSSQTFMSFAQNQDYLAGIGHRTAALADSRLLPIDEGGSA